MTPGIAPAVSRDHDPGTAPPSGLTEDGTPTATPSPVARVLLLLLSLYRATARLRAPRCRFLPTCSTFAVESIEVHGAGRGSWLALRRIARCHPWNPGGVDPVPPRSRGRHRPSTRK